MAPPIGGRACHLAGSTTLLCDSVWFKLLSRVQFTNSRCLFSYISMIYYLLDAGGRRGEGRGWRCGVHGKQGS